MIGLVILVAKFVHSAVQRRRESNMIMFEPAESPMQEIQRARPAENNSTNNQTGGYANFIDEVSV